MEIRRVTFWIGGTRGLFRATTGGLERVATDISISRYWTLVTACFRYKVVRLPPLTLTRDGKLWMATIQGLAMLDLPHLPKSERKPAIYMKELTVDRNRQLPR